MSSVRRRGGSLFALVVAAVWFGWWVLSPQRPPNILLILVDSLRADQVAPPSSEESTMPFVTGLAARGLYYDRAYAPAPWTLPSVASLFLGRYPTEHQVSWWGQQIPRTDATLAGVLRSHGYVTGGFSAHPGIGAQHDLDQGFDRFATVGEPKFFNSPDAAEVNAAALDWIDTVRGETAPFFLYLHYMDVHLPYRPHPKHTAPRSAQLSRGDLQLSADASRGSSMEEAERRELWSFTPAERERLRQLYAGEARYLDRKLADLFAAMERRGVLRDTVVIVTADHGEELGEHDIFGHATTLYETMLRIPLVMTWPGASDPQRIPEPVAMGGLGSSLLSELRIEVPAEFHIPAFRIRGPTPVKPSPHVFAELLDTHSLPLRLHAEALVGETAKLLVTPAGEEIVFVDDPLERSPRNDAPEAAELRAALHATQQAFAAAEEASDVPLDAETRERLRRLGYEIEK